MNNFNIIIDCGHGGIDSNGKYTTAPNKMHKFDEDLIAYEGVLNRQIGNKIGSLLRELGICVYYTVHPSDPQDVSLKNRVTFANGFNPKETFFISLHSNASPSHNARGFEIFTSVGETISDILATYVGEEIIDEFPNNRFRTDFSDGDLDKESQFYVLRKTKCPSILIENLFFDNIDDFKLLSSETFQKRLSWRISNGIIRFLKTIR